VDALSKQDLPPGVDVEIKAFGHAVKYEFWISRQRTAPFREKTR